MSKVLLGEIKNKGKKLL